MMSVERCPFNGGPCDIPCCMEKCEYCGSVIPPDGSVTCCDEQEHEQEEDDE